MPEKEAARVINTGRPGGLFRIDQEVVTLRGLPGNSGLRRDLNAGRNRIQTHR